MLNLVIKMVTWISRLAPRSLEIQVPLMIDGNSFSSGSLLHLTNQERTWLFADADLEIKFTGHLPPV